MLEQDLGQRIVRRELLRCHAEPRPHDARPGADARDAHVAFGRHVDDEVDGKKDSEDHEIEEEDLEGYSKTNDPVLRRLVQLVMSDEAFHHRFGRSPKRGRSRSSQFVRFSQLQ